MRQAEMSKKVPDVPVGTPHPNPLPEGEGNFPASEGTPGQRESRSAYQALLDQAKEFKWWNDFLEIKEEFSHFRNWRIWVYIAWSGSPARDRQPATEEKLAGEVLGCSDRVIRKWKKKVWRDKGENRLPAVEEAVAWVQASPLLRHRRDIYEAMVRSALLTGSQGFADRKLALEMMGDFERKISGKLDVVGMTVEEWREEQERRRQEVAETLAMFDDEDEAITD